MSAAVSPLHILQSTSLVSVVQDEIVKLIMQGEFELGEKLSELALAHRLGVSRGPVREAFRGLEAAGLVTITKNRGVFVKQFSPDDIRELYEVRVAMDEMVGRLLAPRITDEHLDELDKLVAEMDRTLRKDDLLKYFPQNIKFHDRIVELTGNRKLVAMYRRITTEMHVIRRRGIVSGGGKQFSNQEHRDIVRALATRDGERAASAMGKHGRAGYERLLAISISASHPQESD